MEFKRTLGLLCAAVISVLPAGVAFSQEKTVKVGAVFPLSGNAASAGTHTKAAIELAADIINNAHPEFGNFPLAKKVEASLKKDLQQQMRYYKSLGDETSDDQLATNAYMILQGKGGQLSDRQQQFVQDIFTTYRMLLQIDQMNKQFLGKPAIDSLKLK